MLFYIRYTADFGDAALYTRLRNATGQFWDFTALTWINTETAACGVALLERDDGDSVDSLYSADPDKAILPAGGPWVEEVVLFGTGKVIGYDNTSVPIESTQLTLRQVLFAYIGNASNVFSKVCGSFIGTIDFYACSYSAFENNMADPGGTRVCTLASTGEVSNVTNIATGGEVLYLKLGSTFSCLTATTVNIYNATNTGNTRVYVPLGLSYVASIGAYYPTTSAGLLVSQNGQLISLGETAYGKALGLIPTINWDRISSPIQLTTSTILV